MCLGHDPCRRGKTSTMRDCRDTQKTAVFTSNRGCCGHLTLCLGRDDRSIQFLQACFKGFPLAFSNFFSSFRSAGCSEEISGILLSSPAGECLSVGLELFPHAEMQTPQSLAPTNWSVQRDNSIHFVDTSLITFAIYVHPCSVKVRIIVGISHLYNHITI